MQIQAIEAVHNLKGVIPWTTLLQWLKTYGLPIVEQVLIQLLPLILAGKVSPAVIAWAEAAMQALMHGQPLPPLPVTP